MSISSKREESSGANTFLLDQINHYQEKVVKLNAEIAELKKDESIILYTNLLEMQKRLDELLVQYTEDHPAVIKEKTAIDTLKAKYKFSEKKLRLASDRMNRLNDLERERESTKKIYDDLTSTYSKSEVTSQAELQDNAGTFKIVDPAILPIAPISPNRIRIILLGIIGGIAGATGLIILLDTFDDTIKNVDTIKRLGVPVLAIIPHIQDPHELIRARRNNIFFYALSGLYIVLLGVVIFLEQLGLLG
jgi:uncharacterized protein involved in exopolysaccharide biosynthesis